MEACEKLSSVRDSLKVLQDGYAGHVPRDKNVMYKLNSACFNFAVRPHPQLQKFADCTNFSSCGITISNVHGAIWLTFCWRISRKCWSSFIKIEKLIATLYSLHSSGLKIADHDTTRNPSTAQSTRKCSEKSTERQPKIINGQNRYLAKAISTQGLTFMHYKGPIKYWSPLTPPTQDACVIHEILRG